MGEGAIAGILVIGAIYLILCFLTPIVGLILSIAAIVGGVAIFVAGATDAVGGLVMLIATISLVSAGVLALIVQIYRVSYIIRRKPERWGITIVVMIVVALLGFGVVVMLSS